MIIPLSIWSSDVHLFTLTVSFVSVQDRGLNVDVLRSDASHLISN